MSNWAKKPTESNATEEMKKAVKTDLTRATFYLDKNLIKQFKLICVDKNISMSSVLNDFMTNYISTYK